MMLHFAQVRRAGFTLIEIMIVIAIIAILAAIAVPNIRQARFEAGITACQENCKTGLQAVQMALVRHTWKELGDAMGSFGGYGKEGSMEAAIGELDFFAEAGYIKKNLRCSLTNAEYVFDMAIEYPSPSHFYRDPDCSQACPPTSTWLCVYCNKYHWTPDGEHVIIPCYEESFGACFRGEEA